MSSAVPRDPLLLWQAAQRIGVSPQIVRRDVRSGRLPARRLPGRNGLYLIDPAALDAYARDLAVTR